MPRVAAKERDAFIEDRRLAIMDSALRLWAERGFDATPVEAIAKDAGMSKGTVYLYFPSKQALLDEIVLRHSLLPDVERLVEGLRDQPLEAVVRLLVETAWRRLQQERDLIRVLIRELPTHLAQARYFIERVVVPTNRLFASFLDEKLGEERAGELNTLVAGRGLIGMVLVWFATQEILGGAEVLPVPEDEVTATIAELFLRGALGRAGASEASD